ncbi:MAG: gliding motility lipoprotein GldH [Crocinitomicaceae bacterium]|jgi:gliding motility-associated lipoprotein GldH|nr:gliding motility lipoprotein GldH [Crocinitomicaceae bacterium]MDP4724562.1 gliding motility lipoprotein GldH [Crocinitomicaceae bacterium]MDP4739080.1 gliding motility lipoprotein GldH [Crocinitomicaceae bacterium]MDP4799762.1 gliding motility lipoprotein GldH [Crocinitomicaceae bacterium]MDP4806123.1 gliding motility lipoprotein GldH [Crocinitomicaceae bacterium]
MKKLVSVFFLLSLLTASCTKKAIYTKAYRFKNEQWTQSVKPSFEVDIQDTTQLYDFIFTLRSTTDYAYNNLWIFLRTTPPFGKSVREPYEIKTADANGNWIGKKSGTVVEHQLIFKRRKVPFKGKYKFKLEQAITEKSVDEVLDISLEVKISEAE